MFDLIVSVLFVSVTTPRSTGKLTKNLPLCESVSSTMNVFTFPVLVVGFPSFGPYMVVLKTAFSDSSPANPPRHCWSVVSNKCHVFVVEHAHDFHSSPGKTRDEVNKLRALKHGWLNRQVMVHVSNHVRQLT